MRLSSTTLHRLNGRSVERFRYDRSKQAVGIVHFGIGAFHRAHQAWYTDRAMDLGDRDWAIAGVSLRSDKVAGQLNPQDGLYTVAEHSGTASALRVVGSVKEVIVGSSQPGRVTRLLGQPTTRIATFTVTEKGYCRAADGSLDSAKAGSDSIYPLLATALASRKQLGLPGLTLISCDNLPDNGRVLASLTAEYLEQNDPSLARWVAAECAFPSTMVDRIVPAATAESCERTALELGLDDLATVSTEPFSQWVLEDRFASARPRWEAVGAQLVEEVAPYETAKLRMLNGAHSALAYLGLERGYIFVHEAIVDPDLRAVVDRLVRMEAATSFRSVRGQDLIRYADELMKRFENPALRHRLSQIAMDGSQKIPGRWLSTLADQRERQVTCPSLLTALGAWFRYTRDCRTVIEDPLAANLSALWQDNGFEQVIQAVLGPAGLLNSPWTPDANEIAIICRSAASPSTACVV